jgi:hypothetical protein
VRENGTTVGAATSGNSSSSSDNSSDMRDLTLKQVGILQRHTEAVACLLAVQDDDVEVRTINYLAICTFKFLHLAVTQHITYASTEIVDVYLAWQ